MPSLQEEIAKTLQKLPEKIIAVADGMGWVPGETSSEMAFSRLRSTGHTMAKTPGERGPGVRCGPW
ncbi:MAG TPA: hypothetical protein VFI53_18770 [Myxococcaceae bacterium]|nr:hypothetical protein [Myxococcaceae bacterium]